MTRLILLPFLLLPNVVICFVATRTTTPCCDTRLASLSDTDNDNNWLSLGDSNGAVRKKVLEEGNGDAPQIGSEVSVDYVGTIVEDEWSVDDVIECWLSTQQGYDDDEIADAFRKLDVDGSKLFDESYFTDEFVSNELGISNKIKCKKLGMAARRLGKQRADIQYGTEFDSSRDRGPYKFILGPKGKAIKAMDMGVSTMKVGETCVIVCRSDYAYGSEGLSKANGDVVVSPYQTLSFEVKLLGNE